MKKVESFLHWLTVTLTAFFAAFPDQAILVWNMLPSEFKATLPESWVRAITVVILVMSISYRSIQRRKLENNQNEPAS